MSDYHMESALTREVQPCLVNTDLIPDHKPSQLGMFSSVRDKEKSINTDLIPDHKPSQLGMFSSVGDKEKSIK